MSQILTRNPYLLGGLVAKRREELDYSQDALASKLRADAEQHKSVVARISELENGRISKETDIKKGLYPRIFDLLEIGKNDIPLIPAGMSPPSASFLMGDWIGDSDQDNYEDDRKTKVELSIDSSEAHVSGIVKFHFNNPKLETKLFEIRVTGHFFDDEYIWLYYNNTTVAIRQFGVIIAHLYAADRRLSGRYTGFGPVSEGVISGAFTLRKKVTVR